MVEKRKKHRRLFIPTTRFPLRTQVGDLIASERRRLPIRRVNDIAVKESFTKTSFLDCADTIRSCLVLYHHQTPAMYRDFCF